MNKIFIDCGCNNGDTIKQFFKGEFEGIDPEGFKALAFDPLNKYFSNWERLEREYLVCFYDMAAWTDNGMMEFSENEKDIRSTLAVDKNNYLGGQHYQVQVFDLSEYIKRYKDRRLVVKLDIEGAEYDVLEKMIDNGTILYIDQLFVEFHDDKMTGDYVNRHKKIVKALKKLKINFKDWA